MAATKDRLHVLVVDDEIAMASSLRDVLEVSGYDVTVAHCAEGAIEKVRERAPDCLLMDIRMPGENGLSVYRRIRDLAPEAFVLFMTAYTESKLVDQAHREGAIDVLFKPLNFKRLFDLIERSVATRPILVVDDDPVFNQSLSESLSAQGFDVTTARDGESAVAIFRNQPRRVVVLDMRLGGQSGLDVLRAFKLMNPHAIVILVSGHPELRNDMEHGLSMSASAVYMKPLKVETLIGTIRALIEQRGLDSL